MSFPKVTRNAYSYLLRHGFSLAPRARPKGGLFSGRSVPQMPFALRVRPTYPQSFNHLPQQTFPASSSNLFFPKRKMTRGSVSEPFPRRQGAERRRPSAAVSC